MSRVETEMKGRGMGSAWGLHGHLPGWGPLGAQITMLCYGCGMGLGRILACYLDLDDGGGGDGVESCAKSLSTVCPPGALAVAG